MRFGGAWTIQSSSENMTGCLRIIRKLNESQTTYNNYGFFLPTEYDRIIEHVDKGFPPRKNAGHEVVKKLQELLHDLFFVIVFFLPYRFTRDCDYSNKYNRFSIANNILHDITAQLNYQ